MLIFWCLIASMLILALFIAIKPLWQFSKSPLIAVTILLPILSLSLYAYWGDSAGLAKSYEAQADKKRVDKFLAKYKSPDKIVALMEKRLQKDPNSVKGWSLLAKLYMSLGRLDAAVAAFTKANALAPNDVKIILPYAEALFYAQKQSLSGKPQILLDKVLQQNPNNAMALNLMAVDAYLHKHYARAIALWEKLLKQYPAQSESANTVREAIAKAQLTAGGEAKKIQLNVQVNTHLKFAPDATLLVYAKAEPGPPMPVAIIKRKAADLPVKVTLDDSNAMLAQVKLSRYKTIRIYARISKTGLAKPQPGDLFGKSALIDTRKQRKTITIEIHESVPRKG